MAIPELRWLVAGFPLGSLGSNPGQVMGFVVDEVALGQFSQSTLVSCANSYSIGCSIIIIIDHLVLAQSAI
jgi:hypothetical protein